MNDWVEAARLLHNIYVSLYHSACSKENRHQIDNAIEMIEIMVKFWTSNAFYAFSVQIMSDKPSAFR